MFRWGYVEDYFAKIGVVALTLQVLLRSAQRIQVLGHTTNLEQTVDSMQIDHLRDAGRREETRVGIKVIGRARAAGITLSAEIGLSANSVILFCDRRGCRRFGCQCYQPRLPRNRSHRQGPRSRPGPCGA